MMPWRRESYPLQYSVLGKFMDSRAWWTTIYGVAKSRTRLLLSILFIYIRLGHPPLLFLILSASLLFRLAKGLSILLIFFFLEIQLQYHWFSVLFLFNLFIFIWRIITLQYCVSFCHISLYPFLFHLSQL